MNAAEVVRLLGLVPLEPEGGYFRRTYTAKHVLTSRCLPAGFSGPHPLATAIYYLLTPDTCSRLHRLRGDEIWHFYLGDPVTLVLLYPDGAGETITLGHDLAAGQQVQAVVPAGTWQGAVLRPGGRFALMGTTNAPGFDPADFELGRRQTLLGTHPEWRAWIERLT